jgi:predicted flap endonuclease-1-like 5' DNA nuclease
MPTSASMATPSATPRALAAPRPALVSRPATERPAERTTTASLADAALQARLRHVETHVDELPKWTARIAALESDPRFAALDTQLETLAAGLASLHAKLDATVASLASLLDRTSGLERARDEGRARADRALDVATAAHEASRGLDVRARETSERVRALDDALRALEAALTSEASRSKDAGGSSVGSNAAMLALEERLATLERASDATLRTRVEAMEARLVSLVARFADIAARAPGEGGGRASLLPPPPTPTPPAPVVPTSPSSEELEALVRELVRRELADHEPPRDEPRAKPKKRRAPEAEATDADPLTTVKGVGPAFAERLRANDVGDVATLAQLDEARLDALARAVGAPIAKLRKWREAARAMV